MTPEARQAALDHMTPLIRGMVDNLAPVAVVRCAQIVANRAVEKRDRLQALHALLRFAARGEAGAPEARTVLALMRAGNAKRE